MSVFIYHLEEYRGVAAYKFFSCNEVFLLLYFPISISLSLSFSLPFSFSLSLFLPLPLFLPHSLTTE